MQRDGRRQPARPGRKDIHCFVMMPFGDWLARNLAQPLLDKPETLMAFLGSFLVCYYLGLLGRSRIERLYSRLWRDRCDGCPRH